MLIEVDCKIEILDKKIGISAYLDKARETFGQVGRIDELDGLTIDLPDGWFNLRPSNTEPLLRLNVEGHTQKAMEKIKKQVLAFLE